MNHIDFYVTFFQPLFADDDNNLWDFENEDEQEGERQRSSDDHNVMDELSNSKLNSSSIPEINCESHSSTPSLSSQTGLKKPPLKIVIKRLQHPTISTASKYKLTSVNTSLPVTT